MVIEMPDTTTVRGLSRGHAHDVSLDDTFDFLNTDDLENGSRVERLPTLDAAMRRMAKGPTAFVS